MWPTFFSVSRDNFNTLSRPHKTNTASKVDSLKFALLLFYKYSTATKAMRNKLALRGEKAKIKLKLLEITFIMLTKYALSGFWGTPEDKDGLREFQRSSKFFLNSSTINTGLGYLSWTVVTKLSGSYCFEGGDSFWLLLRGDFRQSVGVGSYCFFLFSWLFESAILVVGCWRVPVLSRLTLSGGWGSTGNRLSTWIGGWWKDYAPTWQPAPLSPPSLLPCDPGGRARPIFHPVTYYPPTVNKSPRWEV